MSHAIVKENGYAVVKNKDFSGGTEDEMSLQTSAG
jgi:hypothetical protein